jgi:uncharacterized repeat protein (TIGR03803 family)
MSRKHGVLMLAGSILILAVAGNAWAGSEKVLYQFMSNQDGYTPLTGVLLVKGKIYGTTFQGGPPGWGTIYELRRTESGWTKKTIYAFTRGRDGGLPWSELTTDEAGNLYGTTTQGGDLRTGCGTVFKETLGPKGWKETVLHQFNLRDGCGPAYELLRDDAGSLYGVAASGGDSSCVQGGCGTLFRLSRSRTDWKLTTLHYFHGSDGEGPDSLFRDSEGNLYGSTYAGGTGKHGTVFKLSPSGKGRRFTTLYNFTGGADGNTPFAHVALDKNGAIYGTTVNGGMYGLGVVYKLTPSKSIWSESVLHNFVGDADGSYPYGNMLFDSQGNLYGTSSEGGAYGQGAIFRLTNSGGTWTESVVYSFNGSDGAAPFGDLIWNAAGNLYGTTSASGDFCNGHLSGCGNVYEFTP